MSYVCIPAFQPKTQYISHKSKVPSKHTSRNTGFVKGSPADTLVRVLTISLPLYGGQKRIAMHKSLNYAHVAYDIDLNTLLYNMGKIFFYFCSLLTITLVVICYLSPYLFLPASLLGNR